MIEVVSAKPFEHPPSRIPVPTRRASLNVDSLILQQHSAANGQIDGRPGSASSARPAPNRRQSLMLSTGSRKSSFSEKNRDPGDRAELHEAYRRSTEIYSSEVPIPSPSFKPAALDGSASTRLANLPEDDGQVENGQISPLPDSNAFESRIPRRPSSSQSNDSGPSRGIPHSSSSYDLRGRAVTPARDTDSTVANGKYGLSRIPQSTVMHAVSLHPTPSMPVSPNKRFASSPSPSDPTLRSPFLGVDSPVSPYPVGNGYLGLGYPTSPDDRTSPQRRSTAGSVASTKVIDGLQTELQHLKVVLEKTRQDLRSSQRVVGSLTRQSEDLKDTKDRLRGEIDTLNNALKRRERLLQETVDRARTAEAELHEIKSSRKVLEQITKKQLQSMTAQVTEATFAQTKADRECSTLKESVKSLRDAWAREMKSVREEWRSGQNKERQERDEARMKHMALAKLVQSQTADRQSIQALATDVLAQSNAMSVVYEDQLAAMRTEVARNASETKSAQETTRQLATELLHLRRLMRAEPREDLITVANG